VIDQAKGVLMAVHGVDADGAFAMLVETSQRTNTKVRVVAEELLASVRIT
jgi:AmiR/NasT family two-component response regulator